MAFSIKRTTSIIAHMSAFATVQKPPRYEPVTTNAKALKKTSHCQLGATFRREQASAQVPRNDGSLVGSQEMHGIILRRGGGFSEPIADR